MKKLLLIGIFFSFCLLGFSQGNRIPGMKKQTGLLVPTVTIQTVTVSPGAVVLPVHASNFVNLGAFQFTILYDASKLTYNSISNWYTGIIGVTIGTPAPGQITVVWAADTQGIDIADNTFFEINFTATTTGTSTVTWNDDPTPREFADFGGNVFVPAYVDGAVHIQSVPTHFAFEGGNPADPVWTIYLSEATLDGVALQPSDEIAIFDGSVMVGAFKLTEVLTPGNWSNNFVTAFRTLTNGIGYTPGHTYTFKAWDASAQLEVSNPAVTLLNPYGDAYTGTTFPDGDGIYSIANLLYATTVSQTINLNTGFQFISSHVIPTNPLMTVVMADILNNNLAFVRNSTGSMLRKVGPNWVNNIGNWAVAEGYLVKMNAPDDITIQGTAVDPVSPINLNTGFQFVSYYPATSIDALAAFASIINNNLSFIRSSSGAMLRKIGPNWVNGIGNANPGEGYLIKMNAPGILTYPAVK